MKVPVFRRVGEEKLSKLSLGQLADVISVVERKGTPSLITFLVQNFINYTSNLK
jgi:hypothetical protein